MRPSSTGARVPRRLRRRLRFLMSIGETLNRLNWGDLAFWCASSAREASITRWGASSPAFRRCRLRRLRARRSTSPEQASSAITDAALRLDATARWIERESAAARRRRRASGGGEGEQRAFEAALVLDGRAGGLAPGALVLVGGGRRQAPIAALGRAHLGTEPGSSAMWTTPRTSPGLRRRRPSPARSPPRPAARGAARGGTCGRATARRAERRSMAAGRCARIPPVPARPRRSAVERRGDRGGLSGSDPPGWSRYGAAARAASTSATAGRKRRPRDGRWAGCAPRLRFGARWALPPPQLCGGAERQRSSAGRVVRGARRPGRFGGGLRPAGSAGRGAGREHGDARPLGAAGAAAGRE